MVKIFTAHRPKTAPGAPRLAAKRAGKPAARPQAADRPKEVGGPNGPEPTRYGDWERKGICVDF